MVAEVLREPLTESQIDVLRALVHAIEGWFDDHDGEGRLELQTSEPLIGRALVHELLAWAHQAGYLARLEGDVLSIVMPSRVRYRRRFQTRLNARTPASR